MLLNEWRASKPIFSNLVCSRTLLGPERQYDCQYTRSVPRFEGPMVFYARRFTAPVSGWVSTTVNLELSGVVRNRTTANRHDTKVTPWWSTFLKIMGNYFVKRRHFCKLKKNAGSQMDMFVNRGPVLWNSVSTPWNSTESVIAWYSPVVTKLSSV